MWFGAARMAPFVILIGDWRRGTRVPAAAMVRAGALLRFSWMSANGGDYEARGIVTAAAYHQHVPKDQPRRITVIALPRSARRVPAAARRTPAAAGPVHAVRLPASPP